LRNVRLSQPDALTIAHAISSARSINHTWKVKMKIRIPENIIKIITDSTVDGNKLYLPPKLERNDYVAVNKVLESINLKWNRKEKCHIAPDDIESTICEIIDTGEWTDEKKENQFYATPKDVALSMIDFLEELDYPIFDENGFTKILEPSAGEGNLLNVINKTYPKYNKNEYFFEVNNERAEKCAKITGAEKLGDNFLNAKPNASFDLILMNPPFHCQADIVHVQHAVRFLKSGGLLVSIMSESAFFRENAKTKQFWQFIRDNASYYDDMTLEKGSFKSSGTMVNTRIFAMKRN